VTDQQRDPERGADETGAEARDDQVASTLGESLARAARNSGMGQLADGGTPTATALLSALGGVRGLLETILPGLVFLILFTFTQNVPLSIVVSVAVAVVFTVVRIAGKTPITQALAGLIGVGLSAIFALITGRGYLMGDGLAWRSVKSKFRVMQALTFLWFLLFAARLLVQVPLYLAHTDGATSALALTKLLMGVPLYAPLLLVTWFVVKGQFPQKPQQAPRSPEKNAG